MSTQAGRPIMVLHHGTTRVNVYSDKCASNTLDGFARRAGSSITHVLAVGLGRDGRVAGGALASIQATS